MSLGATIKKIKYHKSGSSVDIGKKSQILNLPNFDLI
jgi:hypothetical protein